MCVCVCVCVCDMGSVHLDLYTFGLRFVFCDRLVIKVQFGCRTVAFGFRWATVGVL